ncbi:MAG: type secretion system family protein 3 [Ramlibacter sp.]|jgi:defect-in-organelle-trafficking protein DotB|nr:type secretion system family protein 3 [Ramlibacter sp.]
MTANQFAAGETPQIDLESGLGFVAAVEAGIGRLFEARASDITLQTDDYVWAYLNRRWLPVTRRRLEHAQIEQLVARFCGAAGVATLQSGKPLDPEVEVMPEPGNPRRVVRARCNVHRCRVAGNAEGMAITLRTIPDLPPKLDLLNIEPEIREAILFSQGLGLIVGITGSGKSTLLAAVLRERQEGLRPEKIVTIEAPIEFVYTRLPVNKGWPQAGGAPARMPEVSQVQIGRHLAAWDMAVPNVLRLKADVCVMGEMRDFKSVEAGVLLADTGHATYATAHTRTPAECVQRLIAEFPESQQPAAAARLLSNLRIIVAQKIEPTVAGPGLAFRSWVILDAELKRRLGAAPYQQWAQMLTEHMDATGTSFALQALPALRDGVIDDKGFERLADFIPRERRDFVAKHLGEGWISPAARAQAEREQAPVEA